MLTKSDIEFIKETRKEIIQNRTVLVTLHRQIEGEEDPFTGDSTISYEYETVEATWRNYISQSPGTDDRVIVDGAHADVGDAFAEFGLDVDLRDVDTVTLEMTGENWRIRGVDLVGIGQPNRQYVLMGRVI